MTQQFQSISDELRVKSDRFMKAAEDEMNQMAFSHRELAKVVYCCTNALIAQLAAWKAESYD